jgi:hypothetical protein
MRLNGQGPRHGHIGTVVLKRDWQYSRRRAALQIETDREAGRFVQLHALMRAHDRRHKDDGERDDY